MNNKEQYYIIRCDKAGVFFAQIESRKNDEATLVNSRRLWSWSGAASLSQLAVDGVSRPKDCKFTITVDKMIVLGVIEIIPCTEKAVACINGVPEWTN